MAESARGRVLFSPSQERIHSSKLSEFARFINQNHGVSFEDYAPLHEWSTQCSAEFWRAVWEFFEIRADGELGQIVSTDKMPATHWFQGMRLNYAEHALRTGGERAALIYRSETGERRALSFDELREQVAICRAGLRKLSVSCGDRVVGYMPNCPEAVVAFLACASLGAIWSSCPPEFGVASVLDRFRQIEPKVLIAVTGYPYGGKWFDRKADVKKIRMGLKSLKTVVHLVRTRTKRGSSSPPSSVRKLPGEELSFAQLMKAQPDYTFDRVAFEHPLWILYSSGTTGPPKAIVHGHGGILLEHLKVLSLHSDLGPSDRFFWFSTTGWMMWNYLISGLLVGSTIVLYEGNPGYPSLSALWELVSEERLTYFGTSAPYLMACRDAGLEPQTTFDLGALRAIGSTGAPLPEEGFDWVYDCVKRDLVLASVSGGTDLCTAFVLSSPWHAIRAGELCCAGLGASVTAYNEQGEEVVGELGELVIQKPMPSMPLFFWDDDNQERYRQSYFDKFPEVWRHGDWIRRAEDGYIVIFGRSDSTLNRGGVRMGTSEFYRAVSLLDSVVDSLVVETSHLEDAGRLWLFVELAPSLQLDDNLRAAIARHLRQHLSPRHIPDIVCQVPGIPYTLSGKKLEVPIKRVLLGEPIERAVNLGTLKNPDTFQQLIDLAQAAVPKEESAS